MKRTLLAALCAGALLGAAACGGDDKAAPGNRSTAACRDPDIVVQAARAKAV